MSFKLLAPELTEAYSRDAETKYGVAVIYAGLGDNDQAFLWLDKAYADRHDVLKELLREPAFIPLRSDPRFRLLLFTCAISVIASGAILWSALGSAAASQDCWRKAFTPTILIVPIFCVRQDLTPVMVRRSCYKGNSDLTLDRAPECILQRCSWECRSAKPRSVRR